MTDLKKQISERLVELISIEMGYTFDHDRIARIAESSRILGNGGYATLMSTALAFEKDFLLYGDPKAPVTKIEGMREVLKEIYGDQ